MSLAQRIAAARKKLGISQSEAAQKWGLSVRTLQNWEIGHRQPRGFARGQLDKLLAEILAQDGSSPKRRR